MSGVELCEICKSFGGVSLLRQLHLRAQSGQYMVLLGPSGCGKTTILRIIAGLERPDSGELLIGGERVKSLPPRKRDVAMVFQRDALYPHLTVRQNLAFGLRGSVDSRQLEQRIREASSMAGIDSILDRSPHALSGGESRRAAVAKAMVRGASIRLLDEPLSAVDAPLRHALQDDLLRWHVAAGGTTLHVTHDGQEAMRMADQIAVIEAGRVVQSGLPDDIYSRPATRSVALAIGSPPVNLIPAHRSSSGTLQFSESPIQARGDLLKGVAGGRELEVGIRPETLRLIESEDGRNGIQFDAEILRIQSMGGARRVDVAIGSRQMTAMLPASTVPRHGARCRLFVHAADVHLFDASSGRAVVPRPGG